MKSRLSSFIAELRRRHVFRAVAVYAAIAFVVLQAGEIILPAFDAPAWVLQMLVVLAALGFPLVLVVAWVYALTPRGLERTEALDAEAGVENISSVLPQVAFAITTLVVVGSAGLWFVRQPPVGAQPPTPVPAVLTADPSEPITALAVLPLDDFSDDERDDYFAASMHEEIIAQLSRTSPVRVVSRTSVNQYAATTKSAPEIAAELGVQGIVEGSVTRADGRVRITIQLIHAPSDTHLWANSYEREMSDVLTLQSEVAREVAEAIHGEVQASRPADQMVSAPVDPEAADAFMRGRFAQKGGTPEALESARIHFEEAITIDSTFAPAVAGLAGTRFLIALHDEASSEEFAAAREGAARALELDENSDEARAILIAVDERLAELDGAIQLKVIGDLPADSLERDQLRRFTDFGRMAEKVVMERRLDGPPGSKGWEWRLGAAQRLLSEGQVEGATAILEGLVSAAPEVAAGWDALERSYTRNDNFEMAVETRKTRLRETAPTPEQAEESIGRLDQAILEAGPDGYWQWLRDDHRARAARGEYASDVEYAAACVALGEHEEALDALEEGLSNRDRGLITLRSDPIWDPLRQDPRFRAIQAELSQGRRSRRR